MFGFAYDDGGKKEAKSNGLVIRAWNMLYVGLDV